MPRSHKLQVSIAIAITLLCAMPARSDNNAEAQKHFAKAVELQKAGKLDQAIAQYRIITMIAPKQAAPLINMGLCYMRKNEPALAESAFRRVLAIDPNQDFALEQMSRLMIMRNKPKEGLKYAEKLAALKPKDPNARYMLGVESLQAHNFALAIESLKFVVHARPDDKTALYQLGYAYSCANRFKEASANFEKLVRLTHDDPQALTVAGYAAEKSGNRALAIRHYEAASTKALPFAGPALMNLYRVYTASGNKDKAAASLKRILKMDKNNYPANMTLGKDVFAKNQFKEAEAYFLAAKKTQQDNPEVNNDLALVESRLGKLDAAANNARAALKVQPKSKFSLEVYAYVLEQQKKYSDAIATYRKWESYYPTDTTPNRKIANVQLFQSNHELAYKEFEKALKKDPKSFDILGAYAQALNAEPSYAKAYAIYERMMKIKPNSVPTMIEASESLRMQPTKRDDAVALLKKAAGIEPKNESVYMALAQVYQDQKKDDLVVDSYKKILAFSPKNENALRSLAMAYDTQKNYQAEVDTYKKLKECGGPGAAYYATQIPDIYDKKMGKLDQAIEEARKLVTSDPKNDNYRVALGSYLVEKKDYPGALALYTEMSKSDKAPAKSYAYEKIAEIQDKQGKTDDAITSYKSCVTTTPGQCSGALDALAKIYADRKKSDEFYTYLTSVVEPAKEDLPYKYLADTFKKAGKSKDAVSVLEAASKKSPENRQISMALAGAYTDAGSKDQAVVEYKKVLSKAAENPFANKELGKLYSSMGKNSEATECLAKYVKAMPFDKGVLLELAGLYDKLGKKSNALTTYKDYLKFDPANQDVRKKVSVLENKTPASVNPVKAQASASPATTAAVPAKAAPTNSAAPGLTKTASGLQYKDTKEGSGEAVKSGDTVTVNYTGSLDNGEVFDTSKKPGREPFSFTVGSGQVIKGWDEGLQGMKVGGTRELTIPADLGYGSQGMPGIPANSTLHFTVELLKIGG